MRNGATRHSDDSGNDVTRIRITPVAKLEINCGLCRNFARRCTDDARCIRHACTMTRRAMCACTFDIRSVIREDTLTDKRILSRVNSFSACMARVLAHEKARPRKCSALSPLTIAISSFQRTSPHDRAGEFIAFSRVVFHSPSGKCLIKRRKSRVDQRTVFTRS